MRGKHEKLQGRAVKAGIRAAKRRHHALSEEELLSLKVQVLPALPRVLMVAAGTAMGGGALAGWPWDSGAAQGLLGIGGVLLCVFGFFGVKRTLSEILDHAATDIAVEIVSAALGKIADAVDF